MALSTNDYRMTVEFRNTSGWSIGGTETFRNRSRQLMGRWGSNLQNPSDRIARIYRPDPGKIFVQVDQAGAEALIVSYLTREGKFRELFKHNIKPHTFVAMHLFKDFWSRNGHPIVHACCALPIESLRETKGFKELCSCIKWHPTLYDRYYFIGKKTVHASNYDMGAQTFRMAVLKESEGVIVLSKREATEFLDTYHYLFPEIKEWHEDIKKLVRDTRELRNLFNFPRYFSGAINLKTFKEAYAFIPQSTVGVLANIALAKQQDYIESFEKDWDILNNKHDSVLAQCPIDEWKDCAKVMQDCVNLELVSPHGERFKMKSEVSIGYNWGKKKKDNPNGMEEVELI